MPPKAQKVTGNCSECHTRFDTRPLEQLGQSQPLVIPQGLDQKAENRLRLNYDAAQQRHTVWTELCPSCAAWKTKEAVKYRQGGKFKAAIAKRWSEILADPEKINQDCFGI